MENLKIVLVNRSYAFGHCLRVNEEVLPKKEAKENEIPKEKYICPNSNLSCLVCMIEVRAFMN